VHVCARASARSCFPVFHVFMRVLSAGSALISRSLSAREFFGALGSMIARGAKCAAITGDNESLPRLATAFQLLFE